MIKAQETDEVTVKLSKDEIRLLVLGVECWEGELSKWGGDKDFSPLKDKLKTANPDWRF